MVTCMYNGNCSHLYKKLQLPKIHITLLSQTMPWGPLSFVQMETPQESNDGPILWIRPGEQLVPTAEMAKSPTKRRR